MTLVDLALASEANDLDEEFFEEVQKLKAYQLFSSYNTLLATVLKKEALYFYDVECLVTIVPARLKKDPKFSQILEEALWQVRILVIPASKRGETAFLFLNLYFILYLRPNESQKLSFPLLFAQAFLHETKKSTGGSADEILRVLNDESTYLTCI